MNTQSALRMATMADLQRLAMEHARWSRVKRETKREASQIECDRKKPTQAHLNGGDFFDLFSAENCIEWVYRLVSDINAAYGDQVSFTDIWDEEIAGGNVCSGCIRIRELKRQRVEASRKLGQIRSAITKAGEHLLKVGEV